MKFFNNLLLIMNHQKPKLASESSEQHFVTSVKLKRNAISD